MSSPAEQVEAITAEALHMIHAASEPEPLEVDDDGIIHGILPYVSSPKRQSLANGLAHVDGIVWHYTDTRTCGAAGLQKRIAGTDGRAASWHLVIDRDGKAAQSVPTTRGSWHAGGSSAALFQKQVDGTWAKMPHGYSANSWAFGIELENAGRVKKVGDEWLAWPFKHGTQYGEPVRVPADEVSEIAPGTGWHKFTEPQIEMAVRIAAALVGRYGLLRQNCGWTHHAIDPDRREDPGDAWPVKDVVDRAFAR